MIYSSHSTEFTYAGFLKYRDVGNRHYTYVGFVSRLVGKSRWIEFRREIAALLVKYIWKRLIGQCLKANANKEGKSTGTNPSKRHRERLNMELDNLANLLPYDHNIISKLDRLSILRLSVSYLRTKSYFQASMMPLGGGGNCKLESELHFRTRPIDLYENVQFDGDMFLQALNGFLVILTCEGEVFYATHSIESYLGFHQSDIVHQSVYELVHSEDREELQRQLMWNSGLPSENASSCGNAATTVHDALLPEHQLWLERSFTVRFRCLLDNTSGFLRLDIRGRIKVLHGQKRKTEEPPLALFAICTPFGPPSLLEIPHKEVMFKSKHKLDLTLVSMDIRGKQLLGYTDTELANLGAYDLIHYDDLAYISNAHQELLKTGASGMIAYRLQCKDSQWQWVQTSSRLVYKNSKPDFVISTHRPLMEEEGRDLVGKRTMDFKVSYLDAGLNNSCYFSDSDQLVPPVSRSTSTPSSTTTKSAGQKTPRRFRSHLKDFLTVCRNKRSKQVGAQNPITVTTPPAVDYLTADPIAMATAYSNLSSIYPTPYAPPTGPTDHYLGYTGNLHHQPPIYDNRIPPYLNSGSDLFNHTQYRPLNNYLHPDYSSYPNGILERNPLPTYEGTDHDECERVYSESWIRPLRGRSLDEVDPPPPHRIPIIWSSQPDALAIEQTPPSSISHYADKPSVLSINSEDHLKSLSDMSKWRTGSSIQPYSPIADISEEDCKATIVSVGSEGHLKPLSDSSKWRPANSTVAPYSPVADLSEVHHHHHHRDYHHVPSSPTHYHYSPFHHTSSQGVIADGETRYHRNSSWYYPPRPSAPVTNSCSSSRPMSVLCCPSPR